MINYFGNEFNKLPLELQKEIILQNSIYYQQKVANLVLEYNNLQYIYMNRYNDYNDLQSPQSFMNYHLKVYENKNKRFSKQEVKDSYKQLNDYYKPLITQLKKELQEMKKELNNKREEIENNKKQYYYYYNK